MQWFTSRFKHFFNEIYTLLLQFRFAAGALRACRWHCVPLSSSEENIKERRLLPVAHMYIHTLN